MSGVLAFQLYNWHFFFQQLVGGLTAGSLYALIALGYTMVYGVLKLLNFAHGDVYMVGVYIGWFVLNALGSPTHPKLSLVPLLAVAFTAAMLGCGLLGVAIERFAYRPLRNAPRIAPLITAIGISFFLEQTATLLWGANPREYNMYSLHNGELFGFINIGNFGIQYVQLFVILATVVLMLGLTYFVWRTRTGKAMRAISFDREAASMMGIDVDFVIAMTFLIGSALAGAAGVMAGLVSPTGSLNPYMGFGVGLKAFTAAVVGGIGNIVGAVLGGLFIGIVETFTVAYFSSQFSDLILFSLLVIFMLIRSTGFRGAATLQKV
jgi:branched-chain amino acid transport system permease protein